MTERNHRQQLRALQALLAERAIEPLHAARADELERLLGDYPDVDATAYERAAAAVWLAAAPTSQAMPRNLAERILAGRPTGKTTDL